MYHNWKSNDKKTQKQKRKISEVLEADEKLWSQSHNDEIILVYSKCKGTLQKYL